MKSESASRPLRFSKKNIPLAAPKNNTKLSVNPIFYQMQKRSPHDIFDFKSSAGNEKLTFDKFKNILLSNSKVREMSDLDEEKAEYLLKRWTGKQIRLIKKKENKKGTPPKG